jgi:hypothetical protein
MNITVKHDLPAVPAHSMQHDSFAVTAREYGDLPKGTLVYCWRDRVCGQTVVIPGINAQYYLDAHYLVHPLSPGDTIEIKI